MTFCTRSTYFYYKVLARAPSHTEYNTQERYTKKTVLEPNSTNFEFFSKLPKVVCACICHGKNQHVDLEIYTIFG